MPVKLFKDIISKTSFVYQQLLNIAVHFSSFFFVCWFLLLFVFDVKAPIIYSFFVVLPIATIYTKIRSKKVKRLLNPFKKSIVILGSFLFLFLFFYSLFKVNNFVSQQFLEALDIVEIYLNTMIFTSMIFFGFLALYISLAFFLIKFIIKKTENIKAKKQRIFIIVISMVLIFFVGNYIFSGSHVSPLIDFLYPNMGWILGFSLLFLHLNYLIKEILNLSKKTNYFSG